MLASSKRNQGDSKIFNDFCTKAALCMITLMFGSAASAEDLGGLANARLKFITEIQISEATNVSIDILNTKTSNGDALQLYNEVKEKDLTRSWSNSKGDIFWDEQCNVTTVLQMEIPIVDAGFAKTLPDGEKIFDGIRVALYFHESVFFTSWITLAEKIKERHCDISDEEVNADKEAISGSRLGTDQSFAYGFAFYISEP
jgi:hypothetical protein